MVTNVTNNDVVEAINIINGEIERCGLHATYIRQSTQGFIIPDIERNPPVFQIDYYAKCLAKGEDKKELAATIRKKLR